MCLPPSPTEKYSPPSLNCEVPSECHNEDGVALAEFYTNEMRKAEEAKQVAAFIAGYKYTCMQGARFKEHLIARFNEKRYQYTLFYRDPAGNLLKTVPPAGVNKLNLTSADPNGVYANKKAAIEAYLADPVTNAPVPAQHTKETKYHYNSLGLLVQQEMPDYNNGKLTKMWYDSKQRLRFSQNPEQLKTGKYSYTKYDGLSRPIESGESVQFYGSSSFSAGVDDMTFPTQATQVAKTFYDVPVNNTVDGYFTGGQQHLKKRVSTTAFYENLSDATYRNATHYSYDEFGNADHVVVENHDLVNTPENIKRLSYDFDLESGKVNQVSFQEGKADQFYHRYYYDSDNKLTEVETSKDGIIWETDAESFYYLHGPLARTELGNEKVQGVDYFLNLQGWLKGINSNTLYASRDLGKDGVLTDGGYAGTYYKNTSNIHGRVGKDAMSFSLGYHHNDYKAITATGNTMLASISGTGINNLNNLYNGNINHFVTSLRKPNGDKMDVQVTLPRYDQLNRLVYTTVLNSTTVDASNNWQNATQSYAYNTTYSYDLDGNIQYLARSGGHANSSTFDMDNLHYNYVTGTNKLSYVTDAVTGDPYSTDIESQSANNYDYDAIGNLIKDAKEEIASIKWTPSGKVKTITRISTSTKPDLEFVYDVSGNRITKIVKPKAGDGSLLAISSWLFTDYVHDASGNILATYERKYALEAGGLQISEYKLTEQHIYGSKRLGMEKRNVVLALSGTTDLGNKVSRKRGNKRYELTDQLGNVLTTITDRKVLTSETAQNTIIETSYEGGDEDLFIGDDGNYIKSAINDPHTSGSYSLKMPAANIDYYGPNIRKAVKPGDEIDISCNTLWVSTTAGGGTHNRGGGIAYMLIDDQGDFIKKPNGDAYWYELGMGSTPDVMVTNNHISTFTVPSRANLKKWTDVNSTYEGTITLLAFPWTAANVANTTYFDDLNVTIDRSANP